MSESAHVEHAAPASTEELFSNAELRQFTEDDSTAGRVIGKMLSLLFIYTLIAMSIATWWTVSSIHAKSEPAQSASAGHH